MRTRFIVALLIPFFLGAWAASSRDGYGPSDGKAPGPNLRLIPSLSVSIVGDEDIPPNEDCAWQAIVSGGTSPYSYNWWGALTGSTEIIEGSLSESSYLWVEVTDALSQADTAQILIWVDEEFDPCEWR